MHAKLAGHLPLTEMISKTIDEARTKLAAAESVGKQNVAPRAAKEKTSSAPGIDVGNLEHIEKLASALDFVADAHFLKEADGIENGGESRQGGEQLSTMSRVSGRQGYKKDGSKKHQVPMSTGLQSSRDAAGGTQVPNDHAAAPGGPAYPASGVMKTASESVMDRIQKVKEATAASTVAGRAAEFALHHPHITASAAGAGLGAAGGAAMAEDGDRLKGALKGGAVGGGAGAALTHGAKFLGKGALDASAGKHVVSDKTKKVLGDAGDKLTEFASKSMSKQGSADAAAYILQKIAETAQGGMTLDSASGAGPKPESGAKGGNDARRAIESNSAVVAMKKVDGKKPQKRMLSEVLTEPALTSSTDSKVQENLRNASAGGVKIAAAAFLQKIASDPSDPRHEKLKEAIEKRRDEKLKEANAAESVAKALPKSFLNSHAAPGIMGAKSTRMTAANSAMHGHGANASLSALGTK